CVYAHANFDCANDHVYGHPTENGERRDHVKRSGIAPLRVTATQSAVAQVSAKWSENVNVSLTQRARCRSCQLQVIEFPRNDCGFVLPKKDCAKNLLPRRYSLLVSLQSSEKKNDSTSTLNQDDYINPSISTCCSIGGFVVTGLHE
ncbi:hypothetical protein Tcan_01709, partial [Toxocara canis]